MSSSTTSANSRTASSGCTRSACSSGCGRWRTSRVARWCARRKSCGARAAGSRDRWSRSTSGTAPTGIRDRRASAIANALADRLSVLGAKPQVITRAGRIAVRSRTRGERTRRRRLPEPAPRRRGPRGGRPHLLVLRQREHALPRRAPSRGPDPGRARAGPRTAGPPRRLTVSMLRETRMPAVQIEPFVVSNRFEAARLEDPASVDVVVGRARGRRSPVLRLSRSSGPA